MDVVDKMLGPVDEWFTSVLITNWRDKVWSEAILLVETTDPDQRQELSKHIEAATLKRAEIILLGSAANS
jgi:hypothetical protein